MSAIRNFAVAYGDPANLSSFVIIGGDNEDFMLQGHEYAETYDKLTTTIQFSVSGQGATEDAIAEDFEANLGHLGLLESYSRDLLVASGIKESWTDATVITDLFDASVSNTVTQIQVSTTPFTASNIGDLITAIGRTFRIYEIVSSSIVNCTRTAAVPTPSGGTFANEDAALLNTLYRTAEATRTKGYHARPRLIPVGDALDSPFRRTYRCAFDFLRSATDTRDLGRLVASYKVQSDTTDLRRVTFTGVYTASGGSGSTVMFAAQFNSWKNSIITALTGNFEAVGEMTYEVDDEDAQLAFNASYVELNERETIADFVSDELSLQSIAMLRDNVYMLGVPGEIPPAKLAVVYSIKVNKSVTTDEYLTTLYKNTIRPHIFAQIRAKNGDAQFILERETPIIDTPSNSIQVRLELELVDPASSTLLEFSRTVSYQVSARKTDHDTWDDSKPNTIVTFSPSSMITAQVVVRERRRNVLPTLTFPSDDLMRDKAQVATFSFLPDATQDMFQVPGTPPAPASMLGGKANGWYYRQHTLDCADTVRGGTNPIYGQISGQIAGDIVYQTTVTTSWRWCDETQLKIPFTAAPPGRFGLTGLVNANVGGGAGIPSTSVPSTSAQTSILPGSNR